MEQQEPQQEQQPTENNKILTLILTIDMENEEKVEVKDLKVQIEPSEMTWKDKALRILRDSCDMAKKRLDSYTSSLSEAELPATYLMEKKGAEERYFALQQMYNVLVIL